MPEEEPGLKIAIIDDDPGIVKVVRVLLEVKGHRVVEAGTGIGGVNVVKKEQPDVILLDIMLPDIDGFEVCRQLRLDPATAAIPLIFLSALTGREHIDQGLSLGAQGYITKPFLPSTLLDKIGEVAGKRD